MTLNTAFLLLLSLLTTSGLLLCATYQLSDEEILKLPPVVEYNVEERFTPHVVGIHLGGTHSSVAVLKHPPPDRDLCNKLERQYQCSDPMWFPRGFTRVYCKQWEHQCSGLSNSDRYQVVLKMPSCVAFTDSGVLIGDSARDQAPLNSQRTICGILPLIGQRFDDPDVQSHIITLPYKVVNKENKTHIEVNFKNGVTKVYSPAEILAMMLGKMKEITEAYMGSKIELPVVLLHQSYFDKRMVQQRNILRSIKEACERVGLSRVRITHSRLVAILARQFSVKSHYLVYNLGGSAFDVSLQRDQNDGMIDLVASRADTHLGGQTFDMRVVDHFINLIKSKYHMDISKDITALGKLQIECEKAKISLSSRDRVMIKIESLADGILLFEEPLTRDTFEQLNLDLFNKTIDLVRAVMDERGGIEKRNLEIVLVGGNTRIAKIQQMLKDEFGKEPLKDVNPDEALAFAATHLASAMSNIEYGQHLDVDLRSLSVGIETLGGIMTRYVYGNGYTASRNVTTYHDGQTIIEIKIFEGERPFTKHCHYLGTLQMSDIPPAPRGVAIIKVKLEVDLWWDIHVTAEHEESQQIKSVTIPGKQRYKSVEKIVNQVWPEYWEHITEDIMEKTKVEEEIGMLMPPAYITKFAVVNIDDLYKYFGKDHIRISNTTQWNES